MTELRPFDRSTFVIMGLAWLGIGWFGNAPVLSDAGWFAVCALPAGASWSLARHLSQYALRSFVVTSLTVGLLRSVAYLSDGIEGPMFVWVVVVTLVLLVRDRIARENFGQ